MSEAVKGIIRNRIERALADGTPKTLAELKKAVVAGPLKEDAVVAVLGEMFPEMKAFHVATEETTHPLLPGALEQDVVIIHTREIHYEYGVRSTYRSGRQQTSVVVGDKRYEDTGSSVAQAAIFALALQSADSEEEARLAAKLFHHGLGPVEDDAFA